MDPVAPDDLDRLLARLDTALQAAGAGPHEFAVEPLTVELVVHADGQDRSWFLALDADGGRAALGPAPDPTIVVRIDSDTFAALRSGTLDVPRAIDTGLLTVRGDLGALARARPALRAVAAALAGR